MSLEHQIVQSTNFIATHVSLLKTPLTSLGQIVSNLVCGIVNNVKFNSRVKCLLSSLVWQIHWNWKKAFLTYNIVKYRLDIKIGSGIDFYSTYSKTQYQFEIVKRHFSLLIS